MLGQHRGLWFHTIGQRKGLGPHLQSVVHDGPWYVAAKEADTNTLYVTNDLTVVERPRIEFRVHKVNWVGGMEPDELMEPGGVIMDLKLRHGPSLSRGTVRKIEVTSVIAKIPDGLHQNKISGGSGDGEIESETESILIVILDKRDKGIAPGQFAAFYRGSECLGAGVIADIAVDEIYRTQEHLSAIKTKSKSVNSRLDAVQEKRD